MAMTIPSSWFGVRCFFKVSEESFEERVTLWCAHSHEEAIAMAEAEAHEYADALEGVAYLRLTQKLSDRRPTCAWQRSLLSDSG